jgi:hypothetical protein
MPHLHLPAYHSDADLALAADLAAVVGSEDLYVAWTHDGGAGAVPEVEAEVREQRPSFLAWLFAGVLASVTAAWQSLTHAPAAPVAATTSRSAQAPAGEAAP